MAHGRQMEFRILGPLEVRREGRALALGGAKQRALLAVLLTQPNKALGVERIAELLWADEAPATSAHAIEVYVSQLRRILEPKGPPYRMLVRGPAGYSLHVDPGAIDAIRFQNLVETAKPLSPEPRLIELNKALALWRGAALADFSADRFAVSEASRLEELRMHALEGRIDAELALGRHDALIGELGSLVSEHPLRERLCGQLMLALYRSGRQAEASDVFQRTRERLIDELGMEPGPELQSLLKRILQQDRALDIGRVESDDRAGRLDDHVLHQLERSCLYGFLTRVDRLDWHSLYPPQESGVVTDTPTVPAYVQRTVDDELRSAIRAAKSTRDSRERLVVISGDSKVGKTRTLLEALNQQCAESRVIWLRPADQSDEKPPLAALADEWDAAVTRGQLPATAIVLVLDDLQYHVSVRANAISHSAMSFLAQHANLIIAATCQPSFLRLDPADRNRGTPQPDPEIVRWSNERAISLEAELDQAEKARAIDTFAGAVREHRVTAEALGRLAETFASVDQLIAKYDRAAADPQHAHRAAFVEAAVDHWVLMPGFAVSVDLLVEFAFRHLRERFPTRGWRDQYTDDALDWATEPLGHVHALLRDVSNDRAPALRLHDGVAARRTANWSPAGWIPEFRDRLPQMALFNIGLFLEGHGRGDQAAAWYRLISESELSSTSASRLLAAYFM